MVSSCTTLGSPELVLRKTPLNFTPFSEMEKSPFFSPSALGFTPTADGSSTIPRSLDEIMSSSIFPTPNKAHDSPRIDLNAEMNERDVKSAISTSSYKIEAVDDDTRDATACNSSPDWTTVSVNMLCIDSLLLGICSHFCSQFLILLQN